MNYTCILSLLRRVNVESPIESVQVPHVDVVVQVLPVHQRHAEPQRRPDVLRHDRVGLFALRPPPRSLEVEGGEEVLAGLAVGPQVHAADAQVVPAIAWIIQGVPCGCRLNFVAFVAKVSSQRRCLVLNSQFDFNRGGGHPAQPHGTPCI